MKGYPCHRYRYISESCFFGEMTWKDLGLLFQQTAICSCGGGGDSGCGGGDGVCVTIYMVAYRKSVLG